LAQPWETIFCTKLSHINEDECNAPDFTAVQNLRWWQTKRKMTPATLRGDGGRRNRGVHGPQRIARVDHANH
jgi:threonine aldolase